jgi:RNA polymerase sigma-70 factor (sigma-E family)
VTVLQASNAGRVAESEEYERLRDLYAAHRVPLVRLAALLLRDRRDAEEVVQDAFVGAYVRWDKLRDRAAALAYLRSAVLNGARSKLRHRGVVDRTLVPVDAGYDQYATETAVLASDAQREMLQQLRALPDRQRDCLLLRYYLDCSEAEIAVTLGISTGSVKTHTSRGLATLAARMEGTR